jgi:phenylalanyl-tRNA synthetase beta chain
MKISLNWLNEYLSKKISAAEAEEILTNVGLEVEAVDVFESIKGGLAGVVIGEVKEKSKHPDADRLSVTKVDIGSGELLQIVCGAPNVDVGQKVVVATVGTTLYPAGEKLEIKKSKIRGVESRGMICAEDELGLGTSHDGIMVLPPGTRIGMKASDFFQVENDYSLELNITPNRSDATSHIGVARDVVAFQSLHEPSVQLVYPAKTELKKEANKPVEIIVENKESCPRYSGIIVSELKVGPSPRWLQNKLLAVGLRPINNVVDITNFVQFEYGHPLHAFDLDKVEGGKIIIKNLPAGTSFTTLDGVERKLNATDLMICSAGKPMCIAGVFGGLDSGVTETTTSVFVESAYFDPGSVRKTARAHGLHTDASFRFERGTDPNITVTAANRAAQLLVEICGGKIASEMMDVYPAKIKNHQLSISYKKIYSLLGVEIPKEKIKSILTGVGIIIQEENTEGLALEIPAYKVDVTRDVDVIEEIIRIYGFNEIEIHTELKAVFNGKGNKTNAQYQKRIADQLAGNGYYEILTNSLLNSKYQAKLNGAVDANAIPILNPISSELDILRNEFVYSGLEVVAHNLNHKVPSIKIFEFGRTYQYSTNEVKEFREHYTQQQVLGIWICGEMNKESWYQDAGSADFYAIKGTVETTMNLLNIPCKPMEKSTNPIFKSGYTISGFKNSKTPLVIFGELNTGLLKIMDIKHPVYYAEYNWDAILLQIPQHFKSFTALPKYPGIRRDLALILDKKVEYNSLKEISFKVEKNLLQEVNIFDIYEGKGIPEGKKSYALSFTFRDKNRT